MNFTLEPAGLGGVRHLDTEVAEVKSMYVAPAYRSAGLGRRILARLDEIALEHGCRGSGSIPPTTSPPPSASTALRQDD